LKKISSYLFLFIFLISCSKNKNTFELDVDNFIKINTNEFCSLNSLLFYNDFLDLVKKNAGKTETKRMAEKILVNTKGFELTIINFDFSEFSSSKNLTFRWGRLNGILSNKKTKIGTDFFYSQFYIKGTEFFAQFTEENNIFNEKIFLFSDSLICEYPLKLK
tara:strand:+ start:636 stop:1121 length:486 start_codon:yes stop_codon:yes gene_type:complete